MRAGAEVDADFMVYVAARWPALLREAVLLGVRPEEAAPATTEALARSRHGWAGEGGGAGGDALVRDELARVAARSDRLPEAERAAAADRLLVLAPPTLAELQERDRARRRARLVLAGKVAVPVLLGALGAATYLATSGGGDGDGGAPEKGDREPGAAHVERAENPLADVVWYADGRLHLAHTVLEVEGLRDMTAVGSGVVYGDAEGRVVYAGDDGGRTVLGHKAPDVPVAATDETGLAAWYDPTTRQVNVVDAVSGEVRLHSEVADAPRVVAVDGDVVYLVGDGGSRSLLPTGPTSESPVSPAELLDVRSRIRVFQRDPGAIQVVQSAFSETVQVPGRGARLSPDGDTVVTADPETGAVRVYDARSGQTLDPGLVAGEEARAARPGSRGTLTVVVDTGAGVVLRSCWLGAQSTCTDVVRLGDGDGAEDAAEDAVLAR